MRIELLHIEGCPNTAKAHERLELALAALGRTDVEVRMRLLESASDIENTGFAGSPTFTVNGADIMPTGAPTEDLACRIYLTPEGFAGLPPLEELTEALRSNGL